MKKSARVSREQPSDSGIFNLAVILAVAIVVIMASINSLGNTNNSLFQIQSSERIVYTTNASESLEPFEKDCKSRGGLLSTCGSACAERSGCYIAVCALTCEFIMPEVPEGEMSYGVPADQSNED